MKNSRRYRSAFLITTGAIVGSLAACGGSSDGTDNGIGGGVGQGTGPTYVYVTTIDAQARQVPGTVYQYKASSDGTLAPLSVASLSTGVAPIAVVSDPAGHYVYIANQGDGTISQYAVGADGALTALTPTTVRIAGPNASVVPLSLTVDPTGRFLYVVETIWPPPFVPAVSIGQYSIGSNGALTPLAPAYINVPTSAAGALAIDTAGQHAYLAGASSGPGGVVSQFSIDASGTLSPVMPATVPASVTTIGVAIAPGSQTAYVLSACIDSTCAGQVAQYAIGTEGALTSTGNTTLTDGRVNPVAMLTDGTGSSAYLLTNLMGVDTNQGAVYQYTIDDNGALKPDSPASLSLASGSVAESADGRNLYALSANALGHVSGRPAGGSIDRFVIGSGGRLTATGTTTVAEGVPTAMALVTVQ